MQKFYRNVLGGGGGLAGLLILAAVIFLVFPLALDVFRLNLIGKYLTYAFVALAWCCAGAMAAS